MTDKQKSDTLLTALKEGNSEIIAAVGLAPGILSGISEDEKGRYVQAIREQKCPELLQELEDINESLRTADAAKQLCDRMFDENYSPAEQAKIDQAEQIAREAEAELQQAIAS
jgi:hypothetical protein